MLQIRNVTIFRPILGPSINPGNNPPCRQKHYGACVKDALIAGVGVYPCPCEEESPFAPGLLVIV